MPSFLDRIQSEAAFYERVKGHSEFDGFTIEHVLKTGPSQATVRATFAGQTVIAKRYLKSAAYPKVLAAQQELDLLASKMSGGPYGVPKCIAVFPQIGVIILSFLPGMRVDIALKQATLEERAHLMQLSGGWLGAYIEGRCDLDTQFSPQWWIKKRTNARNPNQSTEQQALYSHVLDDLRSQAPDIRGKPLMKGASHGDFSCTNVLYHEGRLYGIDIQGSARLPVINDVARFLVWSQIEAPISEAFPAVETVYRYGIADADLAAFLGSGVVPIGESSGFLRFFIGLNILQHVDAMRKNRASQEQLGLLAHRYLKGPHVLME